jgi:phosphoglycerate kinase
MAKRLITDADVRGKRVLCRCDFNVPMADGEITDDTRIRAALPTTTWLLDHDARLILCSHLGRPKGKVVKKLSLAPVAKRLSQLLDRKVPLADGVVGKQVRKEVDKLGKGDALLLENLRFEPGEEANDPAFAQKLADLCDIYVNDAFGAAHRAHASTEGVAHLVPSYIGFLMAKEIETLSRLREAPEPPYLAIVGGAKVSDKLDVLTELVTQVDALLIGGGMANTFLLAQGKEVGKSLVERDQVDNARGVIERARNREVDLGLPTDVVVAPDIDGPPTIKPVDDVRPNEAIYDIGPETARVFADRIRQARTIFWNGPLGVAEQDQFAHGTSVVAEAVAKADGFTVIGGGDSVAAIEALDLADRIDHISTGGGASLEFLEGKTLPGVAAIPDAGEDGS